MIYLYSYWRSSSSWRVRLALENKRLEYEIRPVHLLRDGGQQHAPDLSAKNPMHQLPVLIAEAPSGDQFELTQSLAIMEFLDELYPLHPIFPPEPFGRAFTRELCEIVNSGIQPLQNLAVLQHVRDDLGADHRAFG